ncbi:type VI secretion system contractile sheath domain-containing protein, partial [Parasedimentitalea huanghaiensis]
EVTEEEDTAASDALDSLAAVEIDTPEEDDSADVLGDLAALEVTEEEDTTASNALDSLAAVEIDTPEEDDSADVLGDLAALEVTDEEDTAASDALESLAAVEVATPEEDDSADVLGDLAALEVTEEEDTTASDALDSLAAVEIGAPEEDDSADVLGDLAALEVTADDADAPVDDLADLLGDLDVVPEEQKIDPVAEALGSLPEAAETTPEENSLEDMLEGLDSPEEDGSEGLDLDDVLSGLTEEEAPATPTDGDGLDALLADIDAEDTNTAVESDEPTSSDSEDDSAALGLDDLLGDLDLAEDDEDDDLDGLFSGLEEEATSEAEEAQDTGSDLDDLLGDLEEDDTDLDALLGAEEDDAEMDLDDLLGGLDDASDDEGGNLDDLLGGLDDASDDEGGDLDDLLGGLDDASDDEGGDLDDLLGGLDDVSDDGGSDLDDLLGDLDSGDDTNKAATAETNQNEEPELAYGTISGDRPEPQKLVRKRFRLAILGDFSGRAAKGQIETGDALAARRAILLDPDTVEDVIESFATELLLPIGKDGTGIAVKLGGLDDLHPDELYENVELFSELVGLRKQLQSGVTADHAAKTLRAWGEKHGNRVKPPKPRSGGNAVPADRRLSAFQQLIGDAENQLGQASPVQDLLARVVGPHIRALPDADATAMIGAVDEALSDAMRMVLHHPEFQSLEGQWRSLDLIARSVEVDDTLEVMLYDISAEELAADLAAAEDLTESGFVRLLTGEPLDEENGRGGYSALIGLYQFEETPPHAELLGRIARVAAHVDAPFFAGISPGFLDTEKAKLPALVASAWDTLRGMAEAGHLGLVSPRFMLRRPYGTKSEPIYEFEFEEFTEAEGLRGMLWANPVVLVAILLARSFKQNGASMGLGKIMSLGEIPFHYVNDRYGDQVALPCTERNINLDKIALAQERGFMAVSSVKGRDEIRLTSFASLAGGEILGPWTGVPAPKPSPPDPKPVASVDAEEDDKDDLGLDDLDLGGDDGDLDDLLAGFGDDDGDDDGDMDEDLAALLDDL